MKRFFCFCGQEIFFENSHCHNCGRSTGYYAPASDIAALDALAQQRWRSLKDGLEYRLCGNWIEHGVCNGLIDANDNQTLCHACRLNHTIPDISKYENIERWRRIEQAKRRLIYGLMSLGLPLEAPVSGYPRGLLFDFLEDQRTNPNMLEEFVTTGHKNGVITLNVLEADDVQRVWQRQQSSERYRTVLGHFRHEAGHYYYELLVRDLAGFQNVFGDPSKPYKQALKRHYDYGPLAGWESHYISAYASAHPLEDWAECFAHYLHTLDTLETASARAVIPPLLGNEGIDDLLHIWDSLAVTLNELNRSLGLRDAYPFVVTPPIAEKLRFVDSAIRNARTNAPA